MQISQLLSALIGACFGSLGWLFVGLYINRRTSMAAARNAARAVYFEVELNRLNVELAVDYSESLPLARSSYEQLLPQLALLLRATDLATVAAAYMAHVGYERLRQRTDVPDDARRAALSGILGAQAQALQRLREVAFTHVEHKQLDSGAGRQPRSA
jgi:hypothetical protein